MPDYSTRDSLGGNVCVCTKSSQRDERTKIKKLCSLLISAETEHDLGGTTYRLYVGAFRELKCDILAPNHLSALERR